MATDSIHVSALIPAARQAIYDAWLSSEGHTKMTGAAATIDPQIGGKHSAWDGYISGETLDLEPGRRIVQTWRAQDFPDGSAHSNLVVKFEEAEDGQTRLIIDHTDIPAGHGSRFTDGWQQYYITPMLAHFGAAPAKPAKKAAKKGATKKTAKKAAAKKPAAKKAAKKTAKKAAAKKATKKPAAKKGAAKKTAKKAAAKKPAAKKAAKKTAKKAKKPAARKAKAAAAPPAPAAQ